MVRARRGGAPWAYVEACWAPETPVALANANGSAFTVVVTRRSSAAGTLEVARSAEETSTAAAKSVVAALSVAGARKRNTSRHRRRARDVAVHAAFAELALALTRRLEAPAAAGACLARVRRIGAGAQVGA